MVEDGRSSPLSKVCLFLDHNYYGLLVSLFRFFGLVLIFAKTESAKIVSHFVFLKIAIEAKHLSSFLFCFVL